MGIVEPPVPSAFAEIFRDLVRATQPRGVDRDTLRVYYEDLALFPLDVLRASARRLRQTERRFFPTTGEWAQAAREVQAEMRRARLIEPIDRATIACAVCQDAGAIYVDCPGDATCGRTFEHGAHRYVVPCRCRATNESFQRRALSVERRRCTA